MMTKKKITFVTPRYGTEIVGGAEHAARNLAERIAKLDVFQVEAISSCATDSSTWANDYEPGEVEINKVQVHRHQVTENRHSDFLKLSAKVHKNPRLSSMSDCEKWIDYQGPKAPGILSQLEQSDSDITVFYPYMYYPTCYGIGKNQSVKILHPAAHDEPPLYMPIYQKVFNSADGVVFQTDAERKLVEANFRILNKSQLQLGLGVEPKLPERGKFAKREEFSGSPFWLCMGRVDGGKGSHALARFWHERALLTGDETKLCFIGPINEKLPEYKNVIVLGVVSEQEKWNAINDSIGLISPSPYEAFSLVLLEAWSMKKPVIVNDLCIATKEHAQKSKGALTYSDFATFLSVVDMISKNQNLSEGLGRAGYTYVNQNFLWPRLIDKYVAFIESLCSNKDQ